MGGSSPRDGIVEIGAAELAALRDADARLQAILDYVPAWISLRDPEGRYIDASQQLADLYGVTRRELIGLDDLIGQYPTDIARTEATLDIIEDDRLVWRTGKPVDREVALEHPDGTTHFYHLVRYPVYNDSGEMTAVGSFAIDVSDRKQADVLRDGALKALEQAQEVAQLGSWRWDAPNDQAEWSRQLKRIFGRDPDSPTPASSAELLNYVIDEDRARFAQAILDLVAGGPTMREEFRILADDGTERVVDMIASADPDQPGIYTGTVRDVTAEHDSARDMAVMQDRFRTSFEYAPVGMAISEPTGATLMVNDAACAMLGYSREDLLQINANDIIHPEDLAERAELLRQLMAGEVAIYNREDRMLCANGDSIWVARYITALRDENGKPTHVLTHLVDVTERRRMEKELRHLADHDPLTGLLNRRGLEAALERHVAHVNRYGADGALLVLDLDHFKIVNDTLGHEAGDRLIVSVALLLRRRLRASDSIARLGGDEFAVLLPTATVEVAELVANEIVTDIREHAAVSDGTVRRHVSASVGVTVFAKGLINAEEALVNADLAMYDAKEAGRGRVAMHSAERHDAPRMKTRVSWMERIRTALDQGNFTVYGQPIMALDSGAVHQYELLLRMIDESGGVIPPGAFLYVAERYDLIQELDEWVFKEAMRLLSTQGASPEDSLEVNVSGKSLGNEHFLEMIESELSASGIDPARLIFEVTETAAIANITLARNFAERLKQLGCRFALDDFGAGFGSFFYLKHIPFDYLKIDREFITNCRESRTDQLVIESLVSIARGLDKQTIAEGVEDEETELFLRQNGVDYAQGYHIGRPAPVADGVPRWDPVARKMLEPRRLEA